jgi:hypothetical protein
MALTNHIYDTRTLLGVMEEQEPVQNYWLNLCFNREVQSTVEEIEFEKLSDLRRIAPLVVPTSQGRPIYKRASKVTRFKPAYVKPKDSVFEPEIIARRPGSLITTAPSKQQSYLARIADITRVHRNAIERRWEWLAAKAVIDATVTLEDQDYPKVVIDFERDASLTIVLAGANLWDSGTGDILGNLETWRALMRSKPFGGAPNRVTFGTSAWEAFRSDPGVLELIDTTQRGSSTTFKRVSDGLDVEFMGSLEGGLDLYVYKDYYQTADGTQVPFMDVDDIVMTGPGVDGVRCFGAILDHKAQFQPLSIFPKMWDSEDPPVTYMMAQSAPLMVPVNPNWTLKATVTDT